MTPLARLQALMVQRGVETYLVPRADCFFGEEVRACDERLAYISGFDGSAGAALVSASGKSRLFVDGRYTLQAATQIDLDAWDIIEGSPEGFAVCDPWLVNAKADYAPIAENLVDLIWETRPAVQGGQPYDLPLDLTGKLSADKRREVLPPDADLLITQPDALAWLMNWRGTDLVNSPVHLAFALLRQSGAVEVFCPEDRAGLLAALTGKTQFDPATTSKALADALGVDGQAAPCPIRRAKAQKNSAEINAMRAAQGADTRAFAKFFAWFECGAIDAIDSELDIVRQLETFRREDPGFSAPSFDTICGSGPNGAIVHYRVTEASNRRLERGDFIVLDSGGQYPGATTDITRTLAVGEVAHDMRRAYTLVLKGLITLTTQQFPVGTTGHQLDVLARSALWNAGLNYGHGTGHGVGAGLNVHEAPPNISPRALSPAADWALKPGMIFSNEPGYYEAGRFGLRLENLLLVEARAPGWLGFETLTYVPFDETLVVKALLTEGQREWLSAYQRKSRI